MIRNPDPKIDANGVTVASVTARAPGLACPSPAATSWAWAVIATIRNRQSEPASHKAQVSASCASKTAAPVRAGHARAPQDRAPRHDWITITPVSHRAGTALLATGRVAELHSLPVPRGQIARLSRAPVRPRSRCGPPGAGHSAPEAPRRPSPRPGRCPTSATRTEREQITTTTTLAAAADGTIRCWSPGRPQRCRRPRGRAEPARRVGGRAARVGARVGGGVHARKRRSTSRSGAVSRSAPRLAVSRRRAGSRSRSRARRSCRSRCATGSRTS